MRDLFDPDPFEGLSSALAEVDVADPWGAIWARMCAPGGGFGRAGNAGRQMIFGFGVEGRGASADEAARQWVIGARALQKQIGASNGGSRCFSSAAGGAIPAGHMRGDRRAPDGKLFRQRRHAAAGGVGHDEVQSVRVSGRLAAGT